MDKEQNYLTRIERYLNKDLSKEEANNFENDLLENEELKNTLDFERDLIAAIEDTEVTRLKATFETIHSEIIEIDSDSYQQEDNNNEVMNIASELEFNMNELLSKLNEFSAVVKNI